MATEQDISNVWSEVLNQMLSGESSVNLTSVNKIVANIQKGQTLPRLKEKFKDEDGNVRILSTCWVPDFECYESCEFIGDSVNGESTNVLKQYKPANDHEKENPGGSNWTRAYQGHCLITMQWITNGYRKV